MMLINPFLERFRAIRYILLLATFLILTSVTFDETV